jgi:hypothetical protein
MMVEKEYEKAEHHLILGNIDSAALLARMIPQWATQSFDDQVKLLIHAVLKYR